MVKIHRYLGLPTLGFLMLAGLTGSIIAFEVELESWLNPAYFRIEPGTALPPDQLVQRIETSDPRIQVYYLPLAEQPRRALIAFVEAKRDPASGEDFSLDYDEVFIDPVSGRITGKRLWGNCCFERINLIPLLYKLHNRLMLPKPWGSRIMGAVALAWLGMLLLGFYLSLPPKSRAKHSARFDRLRRWRHSWRVKRGLPRIPALLQWHRALALWLAPAMLVVALAGMAMNLEDELFRPLLTQLSPLSEPSFRGTPPATPSAQRISFGQAVAAAQQAAQQQGVRKRATAITLEADRYLYRVEFGDALEFGLDPVAIYIDAYNAQPLGVVRPEGGSHGDVLMALRHSLHTGQLGGMAGRVLVALTGLVTFGISLLGLILWWCKRPARNG